MSMLNYWLDNSEVVKKAHSFIKKNHAGQKRISGELYFDHALKTAELVAKWKLDEASIVAALLHDVIENTPVSLKEVEEEFGEEIVFFSQRRYQTQAR